MRLYAAERAAAQEPAAARHDAIGRLVAHYAARAGEADAWLRPSSERGRRLRSGTERSLLSSRPAALSWLAAERPCLIAAVRLAHASGHDAEAIALALRLTAFFDLYTFWDDWSDTHRLASEAAHRSGDRAADAEALWRIGTAHRQQDRRTQALEAYAQARRLWTELGDERRAAEVCVGGERDAARPPAVRGRPGFPGPPRRPGGRRSVRKDGRKLRRNG